MVEHTGAPLSADRLLQLGVSQLFALFASLQEVCQHLTFSLHADLATAHKVIMVGNQTINIFSHLERKHRGRIMMVEGRVDVDV